MRGKRCSDDEPAFTLADLEAAVKVLKEHNIPPLKCTRCGADHYVMLRGGRFPEDLRKFAAGFVCDECRARHKPRHG